MPQEWNATHLLLLLFFLRMGRSMPQVETVSPSTFYDQRWSCKLSEAIEN